MPVVSETSVAKPHETRNSTTHKREWDCFTKQLKSNGRVPTNLSEYAATAANKQDLFGMWLDSGKDWKECSVILERKVSQKSQAEKGWTAIQGRELLARYHDNPEKAEKLMQSRRDSGLWYPDDDFPDDEKES